MVVLGAGMGFLMQLTMLIAQNSVELKDMGVASSTTTLFRTIGGSFGVALMGTLFANQVRDTMTAKARRCRRARVAEAGSPPSSTRHRWSGFRLRYGRCTNRPWPTAPTPSSWSPVSTALLCFVAAWFIKEVPLKGGEQTGEGEPALSPEPEGSAARV